MVKKMVLLVLIYLFSSALLFSQSKFAGNWMGKLNVNNISLRLVFKISESEKGYLTAIMNSPDQSEKDFKVDTVIAEGDSIKLFVKMIMGKFEGKFENDTTIKGIFYQGTVNLPITLNRNDLSFMKERSQTPKKPYPYKEEEVTINNNTAGVTLSGTLTYPQNGSNFPAVILITGSGPQDRDETVFRHKPFLVLADYLTRNGIAVLRYDDRGINKSTGNFASSTSKDFASDVEAALKYLMGRNEIDKNNIGLIGHSEGGAIAPMVAVDDKNVSFIVLMAGPALVGKDILLKQTRLIMKAAGQNDEELNKAENINRQAFDIVASEGDSAAAYKRVYKLMDDFYESLSDSEKSDPSNSKDKLYKSIKQLLSPWMRYFMSFDPGVYLSRLQTPVLALNGENDLQVPADDDLNAIDKYLKMANNNNYKIVKFPKLNHLFQTSTTGAPSEYATIDETIAPEVLLTIKDWILQITKK